MRSKLVLGTLVIAATLISSCAVLTQPPKQESANAQADRTKRTDSISAGGYDYYKDLAPFGE